MPVPACGVWCSGPVRWTPWTWTHMTGLYDRRASLCLTDRTSCFGLFRFRDSARRARLPMASSIIRAIFPPSCAFVLFFFVLTSRESMVEGTTMLCSTGGSGRESKAVARNVQHTHTVGPPARFCSLARPFERSHGCLGRWRPGGVQA